MELGTGKQIGIERCDKRKWNTYSLELRSDNRAVTVLELKSRVKEEVNKVEWNVCKCEC
jgi:hypothetical protein